MTTDERPGLNTPPFSSTSERPDFTHERPIGSYTAADFPAPAGVPLVTDTPSAAAVPPKRRRGFGTVIAASALAALLGAGVGVGSYATLVAETGAVSPISVTTLPATQSPQLNGTVSAAAAKIAPSVVTITVQSGNGVDVGSGVVLDTAGHILTNNHVVAAAGGGSGGITVTFSDRTTSTATVVGTSTSNDLAVIKVSGVAKLVPATFAESGSIEPGQAVVAVGAPLGLSESVTSGIVSNTARPVRSGSDDNAVYLAVQTDAAINPGNSGGPLVDLNGAVVGINSSIATTSGSSQSGNIGIGFAIPSDLAVRVAGELIANGKSADSSLGVTVAGSDSNAVESAGATLQAVTDGGPAATAGLQAGDVVTKVNDFDVTSADGLIAAVRNYAPNTKVAVTYTRDGGSPQTATVTLGTR
jgi:putative serine protease PepD